MVRSRGEYNGRCNQLLGISHPLPTTAYETVELNYQKMHFGKKTTLSLMGPGYNLLLLGYQFIPDICR